MPGFILGFVIATMIGAGFHLWRGGGPGRLFFYLVLSWVGFALGHFLAEMLAWNFLRVGSVNLGLAVISAVLFLLLGAWLGKSSGKDEHKRKSYPKPLKR